ncbi:hypothetical protein L6452_17460 [Arctium lappa]|uniref:Uncharacterized protein n=1 Tax=Arctium lappa TaxID=4217 RepID=A0ACB9C3H0_ARCLA|nr:hypothetical protein L6452_17460 [Arctium lappa]
MKKHPLRNIQLTSARGTVRQSPVLGTVADGGGREEAAGHGGVAESCGGGSCSGREKGKKFLFVFVFFKWEERDPKP